jgi:nucleoid DNA-binding protein
MKSVTKRHLVVNVTDKVRHPGITQAIVGEVLDHLMETVIEKLCAGNKVSLRGFGSFHVIEMKGKIGRNPRDPENPIHIPASAVVKFKPSQDLKGIVALTLPIIREKRRTGKD